jgi:GntR family histidine utilization transcriptional repressor
MDSVMVLPKIESIDRQNFSPLYQQIKDNILTRIRENEWHSGQQIPSENELVEILGVSRMTVHRALRELTQEGVLQRVHGRGTYVAERRRHASLITLQDIADEVRSANRRYTMDVLSLTVVRLSTKIARQMQLAKDTEVYRLRAVHSQDNVPIQFEDRYVNPALCPEFLSVDFTRTTATRYLMDLFEPDEIEHIVRARIPSCREAESLCIEPDEPCLCLSRRTWKNDQVVTHVSLIYPGSRYELAARYNTDQFLSKPAE